MLDGADKANGAPHNPDAPLIGAGQRQIGDQRVFRPQRQAVGHAVHRPEHRHAVEQHRSNFAVADILAADEYNVAVKNASIGHVAAPAAQGKVSLLKGRRAMYSSIFR